MKKEIPNYDDWLDFEDRVYNSQDDFGHDTHCPECGGKLKQEITGVSCTLCEYWAVYE